MKQFGDRLVPGHRVEQQGIFVKPVDGDGDRAVRLGVLRHGPLRRTGRFREFGVNSTQFRVRV